MSTQKKIQLKNLVDSRFDMMKSGMSKEIDEIYQDIKDQHLKIKFTQTDAPYTVDTFNQFTADGQYLLSLDCWNNVLPGLISRPLDVPYSLPYGFITAREPDANVKLFRDILKSEIKLELGTK